MRPVLRTSPLRVGCLLWRWFSMVISARTRRGRQGWTGRPCAIGCIVTTRAASQGLGDRSRGRSAVPAFARAGGGGRGLDTDRARCRGGRRCALALHGHPGADRACVFGVALARAQRGQAAALGSASPACPPARAIPKADKTWRKRLSGRVRRSCECCASEIALAICAGPTPFGRRRTPIEVWHQDEARVGQQGTLTYVWADKGSRPAALARPAAPVGLSVRGRMRVLQSSAPSGTVASVQRLVLPHANAEAMSLHLAEIGRHVAKGAHAVVVLDGAGRRRWWRAPARHPGAPPA